MVLSYIKEDIINDLVTNKSDVSLSAAQGKILMDKLTALEEIVNNIKEQALSEYEENSAFDLLLHAAR